jgi:hypothetical protein
LELLGLYGFGLFEGYKKMNTNAYFAVVALCFCATMVALIYAHNHKAQEIQACMSQPNMQYV